MTQCVPGWELDESSDTPNLAFHAQPNTQLNPQHHPINLDYQVAELTWENGHLAMHGLGLPRPGTAAPVKSPSKYGAWEKPQAAGGTLESVVNQAAKSTAAAAAADEENILPWFEHHKDALVPCPHQTTSADEQNSAPAVPAKLVASSAGSVPRKRSRGGRTAPANSPSSPENTSFTELTAGDHDTSSSRSRPSDLRGEGEMEKKKGRMNQSRSSLATKRSRAAAIHNQSERKRRDRINQRIMTLQKLVPNFTKTDKASMLDEVIEYLKQLQAQIQLMSKMSSIPQMVLPLTMQQMQLSVMAQMGMGMGMGMGLGIMDMSTMPWSGQPACVPPVAHPSSAMAFLPMAADRLGSIGPAVMADPMAAFLSCQAQPMSLEANYNRMAALYQHLHQRTGPPISRT